MREKIPRLPGEALTRENEFKALFEREPSLLFWQKFLLELPKAEVYLVGGGVRDIILNRTNKDFDFVVKNVEIKKLEKWLEKNGQADRTGRNFGVYKFIPAPLTHEDCTVIDIALPRTEYATGDSQGGYRDFVTQSDPHLGINVDLSRRDFTMNAMAYDVREEKIVDPYDGRHDLANKIIQAVGNPHDRFHEDMSRMLRAIRFAAQLDFTIEPSTAAAIKEEIPSINKRRQRPDGKKEFVIPRETIGRELAKAFFSDPHKTAELLRELGIFPVLLPELAGQNKNYFIPLKHSNDQTVTFALLLREAPAEKITTILKHLGLLFLTKGDRLRVNNQEVAWLIGHLQATRPNPASMPAVEFEQWFMGERGKKFLSVLTALDEVALVKHIRTRAEQIKKNCGNDFTPLINGRDIIDLGIKPGPRIRELLQSVREAQLNGKIKNREAAMRMLEKLVKE